MLSTWRSYGIDADNLLRVPSGHEWRVHRQTEEMKEDQDVATCPTARTDSRSDESDRSCQFSRSERWRCSCAMHSGRSMRMLTLPICFQNGDEPQKRRGGWPWSPSRPSLENLSDRQAAEMVRARLDWQYALSLPLDDAGFDASLLVDFRQRLVEHEAQDRLLDPILRVCRQHGWRHPQGANSAPLRPLSWPT